jgi:hypothetical protein
MWWFYAQKQRNDELQLKNSEQCKTIASLTQERAHYIAVLRAAQDQFKKLNFDYLATLTLCNKIKHSFSELKDKLALGTRVGRSKHLRLCTCD